MTNNIFLLWQKFLKQNEDTNKIDPGQATRLFWLSYFCYVISKSKDTNNLVLKGGFLIASLEGLDNRTTVDIDVDLIDMDLTDKFIKEWITELNTIANKDGIEIKLWNSRRQNQQTKFTGYGLKVLITIIENRRYKFYIDIDIASHDNAEEHIIQRKIKFDNLDKECTLWTYRYESILAEKIMALVEKDEKGHVPRYKDIYDLFLFSLIVDDRQPKKDKASSNAKDIFDRSGRNFNISAVLDVLNRYRNDCDKEKQWDIYIKDNNYKSKKWNDVVDEVTAYLDSLFNK